MLSNNNLKALLKCLHSEISEFAEQTVKSIDEGSDYDFMVYPHEEQLSNDEIKELKKMSGNKVLQTALQKLKPESRYLNELLDYFSIGGYYQQEWGVGSPSRSFGFSVGISMFSLIDKNY